MTENSANHVLIHHSAIKEMATETGKMSKTIESLSDISKEILSFIKPVERLTSELEFFEKVACNRDTFLNDTIDGPDHVFLRPWYDFGGKRIVVTEKQNFQPPVNKKCVVLYDASNSYLFKSKIQYMVYGELHQKYDWKGDVILVEESGLQQYMRDQRIETLRHFQENIAQLLQSLSSDDLISSLTEAFQKCTTKDRFLESAFRQNLKYKGRNLKGPSSRKRPLDEEDEEGKSLNLLPFSFNIRSPRRGDQQNLYETDVDLKAIKKLLFEAIQSDIAQQFCKRLLQTIHDSVRPQAETEFKKIKVKPSDEMYRNRVDFLFSFDLIFSLAKELSIIFLDIITLRFSQVEERVDVSSKKWREKVALEMFKQFSNERTRDKFTWNFRRLIQKPIQEFAELMSVLDSCKTETESNEDFSRMSVYTYDQFSREKALTEEGEKVRIAMNSAHPGICQIAIPAHYKKMENEDCILVMIVDKNKRRGKVSISSYTTESFNPGIKIRAFNSCISDKQSAQPRLESKAPAKIEKMQEVIERYSQELLCHHSNIEVIRIGYKNIGNTAVRAIVIDCQHKGFIPFGEMEFPSTLDGFPVCVSEAYLSDVALCLACKGEKITCQSKSGKKYGSLGSFVTSNGLDSFLTCGHVLCDIEDLLQHIQSKQGGKLQNIPDRSKEIYQKTERGENMKFARTKAVWYGDVQWGNKACGVDMAVAEVFHNLLPANDRKPGKTGLTEWPRYNLARPSRSRSKWKPTDLVYKCGGTTGLTVGKIQVEEDSNTILLGTCTTRYSSQINGSCLVGYAFKNQYEIASAQKGLFADEGDSGSTVFVFRNRKKVIRPVGMITKTKSGSRGSGCRTTECVAYATPIEAIEVALREIDPSYKFISLSNNATLYNNMHYFSKSKDTEKVNT